MELDIFKGGETLAHLYEEADSAFRQLSEQSEGIRALTQAQETWKACLPPDLWAFTRASQHFNSQLESIRKLADEQLGFHKSAEVAFRNSLKATASLPPNILALSHASEKLHSQFESIRKELAADQRFLAESVVKKIQDDLILTSTYRDLPWAAPVATNAEIKEALTPLDVTAYTPPSVTPSIRLRPK